jgi:TolB-like protein
MALAVEACGLGAGVETGISPAAARADSAARRAIANERAINPDSFPPGTVGVAPLVVEARDTSLAPLGWGLADLLTTDLGRSRSLRVVERLQIDALLRELGLAATGRVDSGTAPRVGRLLGARQIVSGAIVQLPDARLTVSTRLADVTRGQVRGAESSTIVLDRILDAEKTLALSLFERLGVTLTPAERAAVERRPTRNIAALLAYSRGVRDEALGNYQRAAAEYRSAAQLDPAFERARSKQEAVEREIGVAGPAPDAEREQLRRATTLVAEPINRSALPPVSDAADPGFRANVQQLVTIIIRITIP